MPTILVVEDDNYIRQFITVNLTMRGYDTLQAETVQEGLQLLREFGPHLLIVDLKLPDMSGWDMLNAIDQDPTLSNLPVIFMTASAAVSDSPNGSSYPNVVEKPIKLFGAIDLLRAVGAIVS